MTTKGEEIIMNAYAVHIEQLRPCARNHFFDGSSWRNEHTMLLAAAGARTFDRMRNAGDITQFRGNPCDQLVLSCDCRTHSACLRDRLRNFRRRLLDLRPMKLGSKVGEKFVNII